MVLPDPFRPSTPQRSPFAMVKVTPVKRVVAPNRTPRLDVEIWVNCSMPGKMLRVHGFRMTPRESKVRGFANRGCGFSVILVTY